MKLRRYPVAMGIILLLGAAATPRTGIDLDGDGRYSLDELRSHYPALSAEAFAQIDTNGDGVVSPGEFRAGQDDGLLPIAVSDG